MPGESKWQLTDISLPQNYNIVSKESEKVNKYRDLASLIRTEHKVKTETVLLVLGALGSVFKQLKTYIDVIGIPNIIGSVEIADIMSTALSQSLV